jgi:hypothetical protein
MLRPRLAIALLLIPLLAPGASAACVGVPGVGGCADAGPGGASASAGGLGVAGAGITVAAGTEEARTTGVVAVLTDHSSLGVRADPQDAAVGATVHGRAALGMLVTRQATVDASPGGVRTGGQQCGSVPPVVSFFCRNLAEPVPGAPTVPTDPQFWLEYVLGAVGDIPCLRCPIPI